MKLRDRHLAAVARIKIVYDVISPYQLVVYSVHKLIISSIILYLICIIFLTISMAINDEK